MQPSGEKIGSNEELAEAIRTAINSAKEAGDHVLIADLISILRIVPTDENNRELHREQNPRAENCS